MVTWKGRDVSFAYLEKAQAVGAVAPFPSFISVAMVAAFSPLSPEFHPKHLSGPHGVLDVAETGHICHLISFF